MAYNDEFSSPELTKGQRYYQRHKERLKGHSLKYLNTPGQRMFKSAKARASERNLDFDLTAEFIASITPKVCPILGIPLQHSVGKMGGCESSPSLDRVDNSRGYVKTNVRVISQKANSNKADWTIEQLERLLKYMKGEL